MAVSMGRVPEMRQQNRSGGFILRFWLYPNPKEIVLAFGVHDEHAGQTRFGSDQRERITLTRLRNDKSSTGTPTGYVYNFSALPFRHGDSDILDAESANRLLAGRLNPDAFADRNQMIGL